MGKRGGPSARGALAGACADPDWASVSMPAATTARPPDNTLPTKFLMVVSSPVFALQTLALDRPVGARAQAAIVADERASGDLVPLELPFEPVDGDMRDRASHRFGERPAMADGQVRQHGRNGVQAGEVVGSIGIGDVGRTTEDVDDRSVDAVEHVLG